MKYVTRKQRENGHPTKKFKFCEPIGRRQLSATSRSVAHGYSATRSRWASETFIVLRLSDEEREVKGSKTKPGEGEEKVACKSGDWLPGLEMRSD